MRYKEALKEALDYLYSLQQFGIKLGLDNSRQIMAALGSPERSFKSAHTAGTNGKGSTTTALAYIMTAHGTRTGLFTSPHLLNFTERIRVDGAEIPEEEVIGLTLRIKEMAGKIFPPGSPPTFFELVTAMAFVYFSGQGVSWAAVETGMGGRLDSTNILQPEAVIITPVGLDHKQFLGNTLREITGEKAGIIKPGVPVIIGPQKDEARKVLLDMAREKSAPVHLYGKDFFSHLIEEDENGIIFDYESPEMEIRNIRFPLTGPYQAVNAALAVRAALLLGFRDEEKIRAGLAAVRLPGRLELVSKNPEIRLDGGHNPEAAAALARALKGIFLKENRRLILVTGIMADKDIDGILKELLPLASEAVFTAPSYGRAARPEELMARAGRLGFKTGRVSSAIPDALALARSLASPDDLILVAGSFYTAGEAKEALSGKGTLTGLRE